ncbi:hypothetical protein HK103_004593 [Boothiomyces macroporosus]|uniref:Uncharacterized protein n=1 Tax=Boothiomyces macroporosus TaxID=261099 RepID=A0AAD5UKN5_9FUNG|nr:hypothetical protein HK103_004593 [Boothiomyces macroporosus]
MSSQNATPVMTTQPTIEPMVMTTDPQRLRGGRKKHPLCCECLECCLDCFCIACICEMCACFECCVITEEAL